MQTLRVLVADEDPGMRRAVARVLTRSQMHLIDSHLDIGFEMNMAYRGKDVQTAVKSDPPDLIIIDHKLQDMSGLNLLETLQSESADFLVIMMSSYASVDAVISATRLGAFDFLAKPFTPEELRASVRKTIKHLFLQRHARKLAEEKRQVRFQSISVLAHELKAPLASIEGYLNILKDDSTRTDTTVYNRIVDRTLIRLDGMRKLILDLLDLTRIESGQKTRQLDAVNIREIAELAVETAQPAADARGISMILNAPPDLTLTGDRSELEVIFNNLISNAVKYNRDNGQVNLRIRESGKYVEIDVTDTGIGMSPSELEHIFEEFYRAKNKNTRKILGSGLGLAILKKLAILYGGDVTVHSIPDQGTTFHVTLKRNTDKNNKDSGSAGEPVNK